MAKQLKFFLWQKSKAGSKNKQLKGFGAINQKIPSPSGDEEVPV
jgi:hypothetical protein